MWPISPLKIAPVSGQGGYDVRQLRASHQSSFACAPHRRFFIRAQRKTIAPSLEPTVRSSHVAVQPTGGTMKGCATHSNFITLPICAAALSLVGCGGGVTHFPVTNEVVIGGDGAVPSGPLVQAPDGYLYGTTVAGGHDNQGTVFRIGFDGTESVLYSFRGGADDGGGPADGLI